MAQICLAANAAMAFTSDLRRLLSTVCVATHSNQPNISPPSFDKPSIPYNVAAEKTIASYTPSLTSFLTLSCSAANPVLKPVPVLGLQANEHTSGPSRIVTLDLSKQLGIEDYAATSPNLLASFLRVCTGESLETASSSTSQVGAARLLLFRSLVFEFSNKKPPFF